jgi:hypothetical protein
MSDNAGLVVPLILTGALVWFAVRDADWVAKAYAVNQYTVPSSKVAVSGTHPHDCDFMTAPLGSKHCAYKREYRAEWLTLSIDNPPRPISYGTLQAEPPTACSQDNMDFAHKCYYTETRPDEHATNLWTARNVLISWRKVEE